MITSEKDIQELRQLRKQLSEMQKAQGKMLNAIDEMLGTGAKLVLASSMKKQKVSHKELVKKYL